MTEPEDPQGGPDGPSDPYHGDAEGTSGESLGLQGTYTTPDGAMLLAGNLHVKLLDSFNTERNIIIAILVTPANFRNFNEWVDDLRNTVFLEAHITPRK